MLETILNLERASARLHPVVLAGPGVAAVAVGLIVWLAGTTVRKPLLVIAGGVTGAAAGTWIAATDALVTVIAAGVTATLAILLERLSIALLVAVVVAVIVAAVCLGQFTQPPQARDTASTGQVDQRLSVSESVKLIRGCFLGAFNEARQTISNAPPVKLAIPAGVSLISFAVGLYLRRLGCAFCFSSIGAAMVFGGMVWLLLYKGAAPVSAICAKPAFYGIVFAAMVLFGTAGQLLLCVGPKSRRRSARRFGDDHQAGPSRGRWRTT